MISDRYYSRGVVHYSFHPNLTRRYRQDLTHGLWFRVPASNPTLEGKCKMVNQNNARNQDSEIVGEFVRQALTSCRGKELRLLELCRVIEEKVTAMCREHYSTNNVVMRTELPSSGVDRLWAFEVIAAGNPITVLLPAESVLCNANNSWQGGSLSIVAFQGRVGTILHAGKAAAFSVPQYVEHVTDRLAIELSAHVFGFIGTGRDLVLYAVDSGKNVTLLGSWDLSGYVPYLFSKEDENKQTAERLTVDSILDKLTPPLELRGLGGIQRAPESLFIATKTYLRHLRDYYREAFPFTYQVLWATATDNLTKPVLELIGDSELGLIAETDAVINLIERKIGNEPELRAKFMKHVRDPIHIATHIMVRVTDEKGITKAWSSPIVGMMRASASFDVNTNNPHLPLWVEASLREVATPAPVPRNDRNRLEDHVTDMVEKLGGQFGKGSVFVPRLKANIATLWGSVIENHGNAQLGFQAPFRMVNAIIADFALWLGSRSRELMMLESHDFGMEVTPTSFAIEVIFTDWSTGRTETVLFTYADLDGQIKAGLDWHPDAPTFFIPREF